MDSKSISPIRASNTPKPSSSIPNFKIPRLTKRDPVSAKQSEIKSIKLEQKLTKDFIKKQKENDLKTNIHYSDILQSTTNGFSHTRKRSKVLAFKNLYKVQCSPLIVYCNEIVLPPFSKN